MKLKKPLSVLVAALLIGSAATSTVSALEPHGTGIKCRNWLTNDPDYEFSEVYKTSVWYENFTALELGKNERNNVLSIAISQLGYHEGNSPADFNGMNMSGSGNYIEYARLLIPNYNDNAYEWCACFVNWCLNQAHIDYASSEIGCWKWVVELKGMDMFEPSIAYSGTYTPKPADMIFFNWDNVNTGSSHIGYVLYATDTHVYTIEGNADNNVTVRSYALSNPCIIGYGTPPYDEGNVPTVDHSYQNGMPRGYYVVNAGNSFLNKTKDSGRICRVPLGSRVLLLEEDGDYARVQYGEEIGYIKKANLYLMAESIGEETLTFDANGGEGAPEPMTVIIGESAVIGTEAPTLTEDKFLGWSRIPYNYKVDFAPGDTIKLTGDTTLYAVWETRSLALAKEAMANGQIAEFERPDTITSSSAILTGVLDELSYFDTSSGDSMVKFTEDPEAGQVMAITSTAKSSDPYTVLNYKALCDAYKLAPVNADKVDYLIFKVKDISLNNLFFEVFYDCGGGAVNSVSKLLKTSDGWQYLVLDMTSAEGFTGEIRRLRIDWQKAASDEGNTLLVSDIYFAENAMVRDAILAGQYVYPAEEHIVIPETEPETDPVTDPKEDPETEPATLPVYNGGETADPDADTAPPAPDTGDGQNGTIASGTDGTSLPSDGTDTGCGSVLGASVLTGVLTAVAAIAATAAVTFRHRREEEAGTAMVLLNENPYDPSDE